MDEALAMVNNLKELIDYASQKLAVPAGPETYGIRLQKGPIERFLSGVLFPFVPRLAEAGR